jgi:sugar phosphate isomerase/epimerase
MQLSLSCRIAESFHNKEVASLPFEPFADLAVAAGFDAVCLRASQIGVQSPVDQVAAAKRALEQRQLRVTMVSGDFDIVKNNERGPGCLRHITPYLDLADRLGAPLIRVCLKQPADVAAAQRAADEAAERGMQLLHQCHTQSLFETIPEIKARLKEIDRPNFGLIFEAANLEICGQAYDATAIEELAPWIRNVYLQNQRLHPAGTVTLDTWSRGPVTFDICEIPDSGGLGFEKVFEGLRRIHYDGPLTVHQSSPQDPGLTVLESATRTAGFLRSLWSAA